MYREADALIDNSNGTKYTEPGSQNFRNAPRFCNDGPRRYWQKQIEERSEDIGPYTATRKYYLKSTPDLHGGDVLCYLVLVKKADGTVAASDHSRPNSILARHNTYHTDSDAGSSFGSDSSSTRGFGSPRRPSLDTVSSFGGDSSPAALRSSSFDLDETDPSRTAPTKYPGVTEYV